MNSPALSYFEGWTEKQYQDLASRLARHAAKWLGHLGLLSGQAKIPGSRTTEDIVTDSLNDIVTGQRPWNPQRYPDMEAFIKMVIVSEIRNLYKTKERFLVVPLLREGREADDQLEDVTKGQGVLEESLVSDDPIPDQILEKNELRARAVNVIRYLRTEIEASVRKQEDRDDIEYILMALEGENYTPEEIEKATGIPRRRVYKLLERIRALAPRALNRLATGTEGEAP
jgi:DNA-directed RNA polymerase specialized sigma24 family protein